MKKFLILLLSFFILTACSSAPQEEESVPEPLGYYGPYYLRSTEALTTEDLSTKKIALQENYDSQYNEYFLEHLAEYGVTEDNIVYLGSYQDVADHIRNKDIDAWIVDPDIEKVLQDFRGDYLYQDYKVIEEINVPYYEEPAGIPASILNDPLYNEPFAVMITGIDENVAPETTRGVRSDVLIMMVVDPVRHHVLTVSFPRDSYVLSHEYGYYDKVNAFVQNGIDDVKDSIGDVLDTEIPYYVQESFRTFTQMIDYLGGVWIHVPMYVHMDQNSERDVANPYEMDEGYKKVLGEWALALARNRKYGGIAGGDFGRNRNQVLIVNEIIKRIADTPKLLDMVGMDWLYKLLVYTNFTESQMKTLIQLGKDFSKGYTVDNYFIKCNDGQTEWGSYIGVMRNYSISIAQSKVKLALTGEVDPDDPYLEDVLLGYTSGGASDYTVGYLGEKYDLRDVYDLDIDLDLDLEQTYDVEYQ